jgi:hypothetical protein
MEGERRVKPRVVAVVQTSFYVQQRDARRRWRTVTAAATRPMANGLGQELRRALVANPYSPVAAVRVVSDIELAHEMRIGRAAGEMLRAVGGSTCSVSG